MFSLEFNRKTCSRIGGSYPEEEAVNSFFFFTDSCDIGQGVVRKWALCDRCPFWGSCRSSLWLLLSSGLPCFLQVPGIKDPTWVVRCEDPYVTGLFYGEATPSRNEGFHQKFIDRISWRGVI